jgi:CheY-like chemotaxis protein
MEEAVRQRALEPFFSTRGGGRLGLGLAIVHATATRHRGTFDLVSALGQGTTARLTLPTATAELPPADATDLPAARVLVIEDEAAVREALVGLLQQRGYRALAAVDGSEALAIVQREPVDIVFTDLAVAAVSGFDVARAVKRLRPGTPVVLITGWPGRLDRAEVEASGIDRVIEKPVGAPEVFAALESALGARRGKPA